MSDYDDLPSDGTSCPECGGLLDRSVRQQSGANRTKTRLVGGQYRSVERECRECGWTRTNSE